MTSWGRGTKRLRLALATALLLVAGAALVAGGAAAWATGLADTFVGSDGSITACVRASDGGVRFLDPTSTVKDLRSCRTAEVEVSFNQKGQKGDTGEKGDTGPSGPSLTNASQLSGLACTTTSDATGTTALTFDGTGQATLSCDTGGGTAAPFCGDNNVDKSAGEQCDDGGADSAGCVGATCEYSTCGDGHVNSAAGEACDTGGVDTTACNGRICRISSCGDGYTNFAAGEQCDDGNMVNGDGCSSTCRYDGSP